ncbi:unnamed protein product [Tuber aestivum]|uniref:Uncharacterized protein n=1 Tax=Tuber aestivum TaxID=59557 RepID=A0A292PXP2_9PEZI|nr:unnamed protein product [Tuber aestivum]
MGLLTPTSSPSGVPTLIPNGAHHTKDHHPSTLNTFTQTDAHDIICCWPYTLNIPAIDAIRSLLTLGRFTISSNPVSPDPETKAPEKGYPLLNTVYGTRLARLGPF